MQAGRQLSLAGKLNQKSVRERLQEHFAHKQTGPWVIELDPTTVCNLACHDCISVNLLHQGGFERERLKELAREFKEIAVRAVVLIGGGEPMAHPEFGTIVNYFYENDIHVGVTSNGTLIERYLDILAEKAKWVRISVDAGSNEMFHEFRPAPNGKSLWPTVIEGMRKLGNRKKGKLGYSFLVLSKCDSDGNVIKSNVSDIIQAAHLAKELKCDYFEVKPSFDMLHFLVNHSVEVHGVVAEQLKQIQHLQDDTFKIISPYTLGEALEGSATQLKTYHRCLVTEFRTVVSPSGVFVCPYFRGNLNMRLGDANKQTMQHIWTSEKRKTVLRRLNPSIHCTFHCIRHSSNLLLEKWLSEGFPQETIEDFDFFI
ncbi:MAG: radical SAM protein [Candidatus Riflebacteria bacterium]|nr:radical SAM protein [Candidatus Riflebacteria bacterium]